MNTEEQVSVKFLHDENVASGEMNELSCNSHPRLSFIEGLHYGDVIMGAMTSQIISLTIVCSMVYSGADQRKHQSSASLAFVWGIHRGPVNSPHNWPVTRKMFPFDDVIMSSPHGDNTLSHDISPLTLTSVIMPDAKVNPWWRHQMEAFPALLALWGITGHRWVPLTKASDAELWCFLRSAPE